MAEIKEIPSVTLQASKLRLIEAFVRQYYVEIAILTRLVNAHEISEDEYNLACAHIDKDLDHLMVEIEDLRKALPNAPFSEELQEILKGLNRG